MAKFWAERIEFNLERIGEVPVKLQDKVRIYIAEHKEETTA